jgi:UDP-2,4-diacetamido-2,4,6-trideoxy-beta-L-altropyranose hydrolase
VLGKKLRSLIFNSARRHQLSLQASRWVDGQGARKVAAAMSLAIHVDLRLRRVVSTDEQLLLGWSNEKQTRLNAFNPELIQSQTHSSWLRLKLSQPAECVFLIAEAHNGVPVGTIRFDLGTDNFNADEKVWCLSYSIDAAFRGLALGRAIVELGGEFVAKVSHAPAVLQALVKVDNQLSARIFTSMRFSKAETEHAGQAAYCFQKPLGLV